MSIEYSSDHNRFSYSGSGQLVSATPTSFQGTEFRISMSDTPYNGQIAASTLPSNQNWFYNCEFQVHLANYVHSMACVYRLKTSRLHCVYCQFCSTNVCVYARNWRLHLLFLSRRGLRSTRKGKTVQIGTKDSINQGLNYVTNGLKIGKHTYLM